MISRTHTLIAVAAGLALIIVAGVFLLSYLPTPVHDNETATTTASATTTPAGVTTSDTAWEKDFTVVTGQDSGTSVHLVKNERFVIQLGTQKWSLTFEPANGITRVPNSTTADGIQGIYEADMVGTTTMHAVGGPNCRAGEACPQYLISLSIDFIVSADATGQRCGGFIQNAPTCPTGYRCQLGKNPDTGGACVRN